MTTEIRAFIFDLDGVLTNTIEFHYLAWKRLAEEEHIPFTREDNEQLRGLSRRDSLNRILKGRPIDAETAQEWMQRKNAYYHEHLRQLTPADRLPGVTALLDAARAGCRSLAGCWLCQPKHSRCAQAARTSRLL